MTPVRVVPTVATGRVSVTATGAITHLCPHADEVDEGAVTVTWTCAGATLELHSLAAHLRTYADQKISHEDLTVGLARALHLSGVDDVTVTARFATAGLDVEVSSAVPGDAIV